MHYHLGLICAHCLYHFTNNVEAMHHYAHVCKPTSAGNDDNDREEEDYEDDDNGDEDDKFKFEED